MHSYDGEHLNPLEVMFAPVDRQRLYSSHPTARLAKRYDTWQQELVRPLLGYRYPVSIEHPIVAAPCLKLQVDAF